MKNDEYLQNLIQGLNEVGQKELYGWSVSMSRTHSYQRLLYPDQKQRLIPQTIRDDIAAISYAITVYTRYGNPLSMGLMGMKIDTLKPIQEQIREAIGNSMSTVNKPWDLLSLPVNQQYHSVSTVDPDILQNPALAADNIVKAAGDACVELENVHVNYAELFVNYKQTLKVTSTGIYMPYNLSSLYFEIAMEKLPLPNRQEIHNNRSTLSIEDLRIEQFIKESADQTQFLGQVELPDTDEHAVLLIGAQVINQMFHCLLSQFDTFREYMKRPFLKQGEFLPVGKMSKDAEPVNLALDPYMAQMSESIPFTEEGFKALAGQVIENNAVKQRFVSHRIAQYLDYPANPVSGNIVLACGQYSYDELIRKAPKVIEILSFSSLLLSTEYLTYSSEIKLAREYDNKTGKVRYLKGGLVSGNIRENLSSCLFSKQSIRHNLVGSIYDEVMGYQGPDYMLIRSGVSVSGK